MGRIPKVQRSAEEKLAIVMEGLKSGKVSETCRKHEIGPALFYRWKDEMEKGALAALGIGGEAIADEKPLSFQEVLTEEYRALRPDSGFERGVEPELISRMHRDQEPLSALCISGGGIRSATFALGAIQGLAEHGLLPRFDYMSTVSGGGYIGSWLTAWTHRAGGIASVVPCLRRDAPAPVAGEPDPIQHLREYNSYLSPRGGAFSADVWSLIATFLRNAPFTVTPLHSGSPYVGFRPSSDYGGGITLGTAVAISGAAASPSMGYHSSPMVGFIMTLFNARLGSWLGNPGRQGSELGGIRAHYPRVDHWSRRPSARPPTRASMCTCRTAGTSRTWAFTQWCGDGAGRSS